MRYNVSVGSLALAMQGLKASVDRPISARRPTQSNSMSASSAGPNATTAIGAVVEIAIKNVRGEQFNVLAAPF
jgi:hypothetical protein